MCIDVVLVVTVSTVAEPTDWPMLLRTLRVNPVIQPHDVLSGAEQMYTS